ncbi:MAG: hypothetical protein CBD58_00670 [bacterium TMED198]|nr:MAG: hypothetical protein CBD58_00670 [bacterium TMED198]
MNPKSRIIFSNQDIQKRISSIAENLNDFYKNQEDIVIIGVLNGCFMFMSDLLKKINFKCEIDFVKISTYKNNFKPVNDPSLKYDNFIDLKNKNLIIIDDIVDSGKTIKYLKKYFNRFSPNEIKTCCLIIKDDKFSDIDWFGFNFSGNFIYGYGMDYMSQFRNLDSIYEVEDTNEKK